MTEPTLENLRSKAWRLSNLYKIVDKQQRKLLFQPNGIQRQLMEVRSRARRMDILKARQFGVTTYCVIDLLDDCIWEHENITVCILAHKADILPKIFNVVRTAYNSMPSDLKPKIEGTGSMYELKFPEMNSKIYTTLEVRGGTVHKLHISEAAFIEHSRILATMDAVPLTGSVTRETTANGFNHFHEGWTNTGDGYEKLFYPWFFHHEYQIPTGPIERTEDEIKLVLYAYEKYNLTLSDAQIAFRRFKIKEKNNSLSAFLQEYPEDDVTCFLSSGSNPFDGKMLMDQMRSAPEPLRTVDGIKIFEEHDKRKTYVIGADPAEGVKRDNSAAAVWCVEDRRQVAAFAANTLSPQEFAERLYKMGELFSHAYKWPALAAERNNHGHAVLLKLQDLAYPNVWVHASLDEKPGFKTTAQTRPILLDQFVEAVNDSFARVVDKDALGECLTMVDVNGKLQAESKGEPGGKQDDRVIANALALMLVVDHLRKVSVYKNIDEAIFV